MDLEKADELWCPPAGSQRYVHPEKASREIWSRTHLDSSYSSTFMTPDDLNCYIISFKFLVSSPVKYFAGLVTMYLRRLVECLAPVGAQEMVVGIILQGRLFPGQFLSPLLIKNAQILG